MKLILSVPKAGLFHRSNLERGPHILFLTDVIKLDTNFYMSIHFCFILQSRENNCLANRNGIC